MSRREEILRKAAELQRKEREEAKLRKKERPYDGRGMDCESMPWGCWGVILAIIGLALYFLSKIVIH